MCQRCFGQVGRVAQDRRCQNASLLGGVSLAFGMSVHRKCAHLDHRNLFKHQLKVAQLACQICEDSAC
jgi:hypothetical protein